MSTFLNIKTVYRTDYANTKLKIKLLSAFGSKEIPKDQKILVLIVQDLITCFNHV